MNRLTALHRVFQLGIIVKGVDGALEVVGGLLLLFIHPSALNRVIRILTQHELSREPHDLIGVHLLRASDALLSNRHFAALYLLTHGATKVMLVVGLWMKARWAYPLTIIVFTAFSMYQMYRFSHTHSIAMLLLTVFDVGLIFLTWREWRVRTQDAAVADHRVN
jgi:uncharacterized membrane protein